MLAALAASLGPGPVSLAITGTSMARGHRAGLCLTAGIMVGSLAWSVADALGLGAVMLENAWVFEVVRYASAAYLNFLAWKSAKGRFEPILSDAAGCKDVRFFLLSTWRVDGSS